MEACRPAPPRTSRSGANRTRIIVTRAAIPAPLVTALLVLATGEDLARILASADAYDVARQDSKGKAE